MSSLTGNIRKGISNQGTYGEEGKNYRVPTLAHTISFNLLTNANGGTATISWTRNEARWINLLKFSSRDTQTQNSPADLHTPCHTHSPAWPPALGTVWDSGRFRLPDSRQTPGCFQTHPWQGLENWK